MKNKKQKILSISGIIDVVTMGLAAATLLGFLGRLYWLLDLFAHFRVQYFQIGLVLLFIALWQRWYKRVIALVLLAGLNYAFVLPLYFGKADTADRKPVRAMLMNISAANGNTGLVIGAIEKFEPDLLLLEEVTPEWARQLKSLDSSYPYRIAKAQEGYFGIMLLSRFPLENAEIIDIGNSGLPSIVADIYLPDGEISVIGTHPLPPIGGTYAKRRNQQLMELSYVAADMKHPVLLIGDLNVTPYSYWFKRVTEMGLRNSMKGFGHQPTWPANMPFMKIPIDHVLHAPEIVIHNRMVGKKVGSDHLPVIVDFSVR
jgi:endonuclease/exonuclease/phosphatase (EEP) superfamily protein YafD